MSTSGSHTPIPSSVHQYTPPAQVSDPKAVLVVTDEYRRVYVEIAAISAIGATVVAIALYAIRPDFIKKDKNKEDSEINVPIFLAFVAISFVLIAVILYFMRNSLWV
jgi:hypothetical protein